MDLLAFLLKTPAEYVRQTQMWDVTHISIFWSEKNEKIWYNSWKQRADNINKLMWYEKIKREDIDIEMNILIRIAGRLPVYTWEDFEKDWWADVTTSVMDAMWLEIEKWVMDVAVSSYFLELKKKYLVIAKWPLIAVVHNEVDDYNYDMTMLWMKDILMGNYITEPFETLISKKTKKWLAQETMHSHEIHNNYTWDNVAKYTYKWKQYTTPLFWIYTPTFWKQSFQDFDRLPWGSMLQKAQYKILFEAGESNYIIAPWWFGKSVLLLWLAKNYVLWDRVTSWEKTDGKVCYYYGLSHASNQASVSKIVKMTNKILESEDIAIRSEILKLRTLNWWPNMFCYKSPSQQKSWDAHWVIQFLSWESAEPGRGGRPTEVIVDEYLKVNQYVKELVGRWDGNPLVRKFYISTANPDSKSNTMYMNQLQAERMYASYKDTMHDLVFEERHKLWLDKCNSIEEFKKIEPEIIRARERIMMKRPMVGLRFDIRDVEYDSQEKKDYRIKKMIQENGVEKVMCELFSVIPSDKSYFSTDWAVVEDTPSQFDYIMFWIDLAKRYDKPALTKIWVVNDAMYIYESKQLSEDWIEQKQQIIDERNNDLWMLKNPSKWWVFLCIDASGNAPDEVRENREWRWVFADYWMYTTTRRKQDMWFDKHWFFVVGKQQMVDIGMEYFKSKRVYIHSNCTHKEWLVEQLFHFKFIWNTWKAEKGKDDKVLAMLMAMTVAHNEWLKLKTAEVDRQAMKYKWVSYVNRLELDANEKTYRRQKELEDEMYNDIIYGLF